MKKKVYTDLGKRFDKVCRAWGIDKKDIANEVGIVPAFDAWREKRKWAGWIKAIDYIDIEHFS